MERFEQKNDEWEPEDIEQELEKTGETELARYVNMLPRTLQGRHYAKLDAIRMEYENEGPQAVQELRINYILDTLLKREDAITEYYSYDPAIRDHIEALHGGSKELGTRLRELLTKQGDVLGAGSTARVKSLRTTERPEAIAVKYLLTPTEKTLSASGEHDMLKEVETVTRIELTEKRLGAGEHIRVPHPLFYFKHGKLQCYGMTQIDGMTLTQLVQKNFSTKRESILEALKSRYATDEARNAALNECDIFMRAVHEVCLHGDVHMRNIMVDAEGILYLIDFGQSVHLHTMTEKSRGQFENVAQNEVDQMQVCLRATWELMRE